MTGLARLDRIRLNCRDPRALAGFFVDALGFSIGPHGDGHNLSLGSSRLELAPVAAGASTTPVDAPGWSPAFQHFAIAVADMDAALGLLRAASGWTPISVGGPQQLPTSSGGVIAYKFRDPDGHPLELIAFPDGPPPGAALPRIDHSAISVAETATSVAFYEDLGFSVSARSFNHGPEQERLDGLAGARAEVTALTLPGSEGPHLELLCYRGAYDRAGLAVLAGDIVATQLVLAPGKPRTLRDPDGHLLRIES